MTRTNEWLALPPAADLQSRLSASAVQTYETCPLQFKLEREWRIPGRSSRRHAVWRGDASRAASLL